MIRLTRSQVQPIGLDIGHDSIKMLQIEVAGDALSVVAAYRQPFPPEVRADPSLRLSASGTLIRRMLREGGFSGRRVITCIPREILHVKNLRLPMMPAADLEAAVLFEARNLFSFDADDAQIHTLPAGEVRQGGDVLQEVIVLAARNEDLSNYVEQLCRCGITLDSLDAEPCALYRGVDRFIRRREDEQEVHVTVDVGYRRSQVVIGKGREISFFKPIDIGGLHLHEAISQKLSISVDEAQALRRRLTESPEPDEARDSVRQAVFDSMRNVVEGLAREISLCLRYHSVTFRGHRPSRVRLVGGEAADPQLLTTLNSILPVPAEPGRPLVSVNISRMKPADRRGAMSEWALALALGLKRTEGRFGPRDGKPRDPTAPVGTIAQTVDLGKAIQTLAVEEKALAEAGPRAASSRGGVSGGGSTIGGFVPPEAGRGIRPEPPRVVQEVGHA